MLLFERCQMQNLLGAHGPLGRIEGVLRRGLGVRSGLRYLRGPRPGPGLGAPSRFAPGTWVRVLDAERVRATLDAAGRRRGLLFTEQQWPFCGGTYRVLQPVRRMMDDLMLLRPVSGTVALEGVTCAGVDGGQGCGRWCPLFFRDEWLEPAPGAPAEAASPTGLRWVQVRPASEIRATLDRRGRRDGLLFMPEMASYAGQRHLARGPLLRTFELGRYLPMGPRVFVLDGLHCTGAVLGAAGPCHRACALLWHEAWLQPD